MKFVALAVALAGCPSPDITSKHGVALFFQSPDITWTEADVNEQEKWFVESLAQSPRYPRERVAEALSRMEAHVYLDPIECGASSPTGLCNGLQLGNRILVRSMGCVFQSAYTHEALHWLQGAIHNEIDYNHAEPTVWLIADGAPRGCP